MKSMKLVIEGSYEMGHTAKIYYHDEVKNVAKLLLENISLFKIDENDQDQGKQETVKNIRNPVF